MQVEIKHINNEYVLYINNKESLHAEHSTAGLYEITKYVAQLEEEVSE